MQPYWILRWTDRQTFRTGSWFLPEDSKNVGRRTMTAHVYLSPSSLQFQQVAEEKASVAAQLRAVSQTLRDSQQHCHWLEGQLQLQSHAHRQVKPVHPPEGLADDSMRTRHIRLCLSVSPRLQRTPRWLPEPLRRKTTTFRLRKTRTSVSSGNGEDVTIKQKETFTLSLLLVTPCVCARVCALGMHSGCWRPSKDWRRSC